MGHIASYALERIAESKALARASARRAEKPAHRRLAGGTGHSPPRYTASLSATCDDWRSVRRHRVVEFADDGGMVRPQPRC